MAGTERGGAKSPTSSGMHTPLRASPQVSGDAALDLLTGLYSASNPFAQDIAIGGPTRSNSPMLAAGTGSPSSGDSVYNLQHQPLDLLTGLFPPPSPSPSPVESPTPSLEKGWTTEILAHPSFMVGSSSELFGTPVIARNNPFLDNAVRAPSCSPPPHPISQTVYDAGEVSSRSGSGSMDGTFATFPPFTESTVNLDLGTRSHHATAAGPAPTRLPRPYSGATGNGNSPMTTSNPTRISASSSSAGVLDFVSHPEVPVRHSSVPSGIGLERLQKDPPRSEPSRPNIQHSNTVPIHPGPPLSPLQNLQSRRSAPEMKFDQWAPSVAGTSRILGKEPAVSETRTSISAGKAFYGASPKGIYRAPIRGAVHPNRPVSLDLRPHPLRGVPANQLTRLTCLGGSVWAACDLGLMVWDVGKATGEGCSGKGNNLGDEDAAAYEFLRFQGSSTVCMVADIANQVVWTGHRDGKMRLWAARAAQNAGQELRSASLTFQAHRPAVTALVVTPYGELWAGSENGELKAWPWEDVAKALFGTGDRAALMEKSYHDLRMRNLGVGPNGPVNPEVRFLVGDHAHGTVWCAGAQYIALWDARTRELLRMFGGPNGLDLSGLEPGSPGKEILLDEDLKVGYAKVTKKDKEKGGWLQRSRNAVMGAADAVRRVAIGGQGGDDARRLEALVAAADGTIWGGYANGLLVQWDGEGYRRQEYCLRPVGVRCMCVVGNRVWVGYSDGKLQVLAGETGRPLGSWVAHRLAVIQMAVCGGFVFSLGLSGSIRGWNISSPDRNLDAILVATMTNRADSYTRQRHLRVLAGTWNTAQERSSLHSARIWLESPAAEASIVIVGLQEVEMGAGVIGMAAVKETVGMGLEKGSPTGLWWLGLIDTVLGEGKDFERVGSRQLAGMLIGVWVRRNILPYVGEVEVGAVNCGFGRALGNKGAVAVKLMIFRRTICALTCHLAAHREQVSRRNADFERIYSQMSFTRAMRTNGTAVSNPTAGVSVTIQNMLRGVNTTRRVSVTADQHFMERDLQTTQDLDFIIEDGAMPELADADLIIWTGDLNYRIDYISYDEVLNLINKRQWEVLLSNDQLRLEMGNGRIFHGFREGPIHFKPTYKFDKWTDAYDTSEKRRIPAWCDRVLCRDSFGVGTDITDCSKQGLVRPCKASILRYESCMEPVESDHKPVRCVLNVDLSVIDEADRRREYGLIMLSNSQVQTSLALSGYIPETVLSTNRLVLQDSVASVLRLSNGDRQRHVVYVVHCEGVPSTGPCPCGQHATLGTNNVDADSKHQFARGGYGFPLWLQVLPAAGVLEPGDSLSISLKVGLRREDRGKVQQDKVVVLVVNVKGVSSPEYKQHRVCISYGQSSRSLGNEKNGPRRGPQDQQWHPSSEKGSQRYLSGSDHGSSGFTPDLLL